MLRIFTWFACLLRIFTWFARICIFTWFACLPRRQYVYLPGLHVCRIFTYIYLVCMFAETTKGKRAVIHEGYLYQKIRDNGPRSWWRCQNRSCNGRLCMDNAIVINVSGVHHHPNMTRNVLFVEEGAITHKSVQAPAGIPEGRFVVLIAIR